MTKDFEAKVAFVTGAGSGIGAAIARQLAARGASVVVADLDRAGADGVVAEIEAAGGKAIASTLDVADFEAVEKAVALAVDTYGGLHLAVNNAGIGGAAGPVADYTLADWHKVIDVNLHGVFHALKAEIPAMIASGGGAIVNMASILGTNGFAGAPAYVTAKHGVVGLTKAAAIDYAKHNIRVTAVGPGFIATPLLDKALDEQALEGIKALHPVGRLGTADEVAALTVFLLSDAASFITGSYHLVDGAYAAQ